MAEIDEQTAESSEKAIVYCIRKEPFKGVFDLDKLIETLDESRVSRVAPYMPKGGEVFVYAWDENHEESKSRWRCDHHRWRNYGGRQYPFSKSKYFKEFSSIIPENGTTSNLFQRITFTPIDKRFNFIIIHYLGDDTLSKTPYRFVPRQREPRRTISENLKMPKELRQKLTKRANIASVKRESGHLLKVVRKPMKKKQFASKNDFSTCSYQGALKSLSNVTQSKVLGWLNLKGLAQHLDGFIHRMTVIPVTVCICGSLSITEEFMKILDLQSTQPQILWFGNTVRIDDYFITALMFRHLLLEGSPLMPLLFAIHDEPLETCASEILLHVVTHIPRLASAVIPIVVERNIAKSVANCLPNAKIIHTWGHIREEIRKWVKQSRFGDITQFTGPLPEFLDSRSPEQYDGLFEKWKAIWPDDFAEFFANKLTPDIKQCSTRWMLESLGIFSSFTGVISQVCEGYEQVIEGFGSVTSITVDMLVIAFHYLHNYLLGQARIAQCGLPCGFNVKREFRDALREETEVTIPSNTVHPSNIVETVQQQFVGVTEDPVAQYTPREYVASRIEPNSPRRKYVAMKLEPELATETIIEEPRDDMMLIQTINDQTMNDSGELVEMETIEIPGDIQQLTEQTGLLQRSLLNGKLFHTYPRNPTKL